MDKIVILQDGRVLKEVQLNEQQLMIGRDATSGIFLDDHSVSRRHALLTCALDEYFIEDLGSTNGTLLNDRPVTKHMLKNGDLLRVGEYVLSFERTSREVIGDDDDPEKTQVIRHKPMSPTPAHNPVSAAPKPAAPSYNPKPVASKPIPAFDPASVTHRPIPVPQPATVAPKTATLKYFSGPKKGESEKIDRSLYTLGRPGGDIAVIARRAHGFYLMKIGKNSVPTINNKKVDVGGGIKLNEGDMVEVGESVVEISFAS